MAMFIKFEEKNDTARITLSVVRLVYRFASIQNNSASAKGAKNDPRRNLAKSCQILACNLLKDCLCHRVDFPAVVYSLYFPTGGKNFANRDNPCSEAFSGCNILGNSSKTIDSEGIETKIRIEKRNGSYGVEYYRETGQKRPKRVHEGNNEDVRELRREGKQRSRTLSTKFLIHS